MKVEKVICDVTRDEVEDGGYTTVEVKRVSGGISVLHLDVMKEEVANITSTLTGEDITYDVIPPTIYVTSKVTKGGDTRVKPQIAAIKVFSEIRGCDKGLKKDTSVSELDVISRTDMKSINPDVLYKLEDAVSLRLEEKFDYINTE